MTEPTHPMPELQLPSSFVSHPQSSYSKHGSQPLPTLASSSSKHSQASVGAAYKLSSDGRSVRRLKGILPITTVGQSVTLINPVTQAPVQSFTLSPSDQPCTPPLVVLRSRKYGRSIRTTYFGIKSGSISGKDAQKGERTEVWAFSEEITTKGKGTADGSIRKEVVAVDGHIQLLHPLCDGRIVATHSDETLSIITLSIPSNVASDSSNVDTSTLTVSQTIKDSTAQNKAHLHVLLLDPPSAQSLLAQTSKVDEDALLGLRISARSSVKEATSDSHKAASNKKSKGRKTAMDVIDESEFNSPSSLVTPTGKVEVELTAVLKPVDEYEDARLRTLSLGTIMLQDLEDAAQLLDLQVFADGRLVALTRSGILVSTRLTLASGKPSIANLQRIAVVNLGQSSKDAYPAAVLPLSKDHVLLVGIPATKDAAKNDKASSGVGKERVVGLLWDLELQAVLAQIDWNLSPGSPSKSGSRSSISLSRIAGSMAVVQLDPPLAKSANGEPSQSRVSILTLPFTVPEESVLRHAMGKSELTRRWTLGGAPAEKQSKFSSSQKAHTDKVALTPEQQNLISTLQSIAEGQKTAKAQSPAQMEAAFDKWIAEEIKKVAKDQANKPKKAGGKGKAGNEANQVLDYNFVTALLPLVLPEPEKADNAVYPRKIVSYLLSHRAVSALMLSSAQTTTAIKARSGPVNRSSSLLDRLRALSDWANIMTAIKNVPDVTETDLVLLLVDVLQLEKKGTVTQTASGSWSKAPGTIKFLSHFIKISVSRPLLRGTLKARVNNVDDVAILLQILRHWLDAAARLPFEQHLTHVKGATEEQTAPKKRSSKSQKAGQTPSVELVLPFATDLLDTYFPLLLTTPSTHALLRSLSKTINVHLSGLNSLITLGAPLGAFAKLHEEQEMAARRSEAEAAANRANGLQHVGPGGVVASAGNAKVASGGKGAAAARAETGGGMGILLGTEGAQKTRRAEAMEESMLVGAYSLERLEI